MYFFFLVLLNLGDCLDFYTKPPTIPKKGLPLFTVLTISTTGSEFNPNSVISDVGQKLKLPAFYPSPPV
jgi:alcohol dehydrogenase YqhD (iron-dependent ADH family)